SVPTRWGAASAFVQVMTSPTFAVTASQVKLATVVETVVAAVESVQVVSAAVDWAGAWLAGGACVPAAWVPGATVGAWVAAPEQAASATAVASVARPRAMKRILILRGWLSAPR